MTVLLKKHLIVGLGSIGRKHAQVLINEGCQVTGLDPFLAESTGFEMVENLQQGLEGKPDMVWLCTPTALHAEVACEIIEKGIHLFIEKPVAHTVDAADKIVETWQKGSKKSMVWVGCNMRFHPAVLKLKELIQDDQIGSPNIFRFHFSHWLPNMRPGMDYRNSYAVQKEGGGIILDNVHDIDLSLMFSGQVKSVSGSAFKSGLLEMEAEDTANINLVHENQSLSFLHMDYLRKDKSRGIEILGNKGSLEWVSRGKNPELAQIKWFATKNNESKIIWKEKLSSFDSLFIRQFRAINERISQIDLYDQCLFEAVKALKIALKVRANIQS